MVYMNKGIRAGAGLDIGTTTVQAQIIDLETGAVLESVSVLNAQRIFGADVMSRIAYAREGRTNELFTAINNQIDGILQKYNVEKCIVSGNTTMLHFFAGVDPSAMGEAPYSPVFLEERHINERVTLLPGISAFVGADIVSGLTFLDVLNNRGNVLFVDIGTNGEIAVWKGRENRLLCCSTAAGPCFEGEAIAYGSDLIDAIALMRRQGLIDETGAITKTFKYKDFTVTQDIIRQFQMAKSAIFSGISVLCRTAGIEPNAFDAVYIAGGMGFYINLENAASVGLLPQGIIYGAQVCGNTSLKGAVQCLKDQTVLQKCNQLISYAKVIDLAMDREFAEAYIENMGF